MKRKPYRILIISPWENFWSMAGRAGVSDDAEFARRALAAGHELHFLVPQGGVWHDDDTHGRLHLHTFPNILARTARWPKPLRRLLWFWYFLGPVADRAVATARAINPDIVIGFSYLGSRSAERVGRACRIPSVVKHFGVYTAAFFKEWPRWKYLWKNAETLFGLTRDVDRQIILNDGSLGRQAAQRAGCPPERITFLLNGIHTEWADNLPDRAEARKALGLEPTDRAILFLARLEHFKGTEQMIRILPRLMDQSDTRLLVAGSGEDEDKLRSAASPFGELVRMLGAVPHDEVPRLFAAADVFLTINTYSNMAIPTCEAMVCGLPVVATDVTGTAETVRDGENGLLLPPGDDHALLAALKRILSDDELRARLAGGASRFAAANFDSWDRRVARELDLIDQLCREGRSLP